MVTSRLIRRFAVCRGTILLQLSILAFEGVKEDVRVVFLCGEVIREAGVEVFWL
jgi:hypothetical protein